MRAELDLELKTPEVAMRDLDAISMESIKKERIYHQGDCAEIAYRILGRFEPQLKF